MGKSTWVNAVKGKMNNFDVAEFIFIEDGKSSLWMKLHWSVPGLDS